MCNQCCYVLTPSVWIAHLLLASTLKAYHDIIPDNLVGGDSGIPEAGNKESRQDLAQHANGSEWAWIGVCCHLHWEALWRFFQVAPRVVPHNKRHPNIRRFRYPAMTSNILLTFMATTGAWLRLCALLRRTPHKVVGKKTVFLQETGFTNMGPCNICIIYIYTLITINPTVNRLINSKETAPTTWVQNWRIQGMGRLDKTAEVEQSERYTGHR